MNTPPPPPLLTLLLFTTTVITLVCFYISNNVHTEGLKRGVHLFMFQKIILNK